MADKLLDISDKETKKLVVQSASVGSPAIAVIIPFFNDMEKLWRTIESLLRQELKPYLIVLVDDCGNERLPEDIRKSIQQSGIQLTLVENKENKGPGGSRQSGMDVLPGMIEYVMFLDSDDYISDNCLSVLWKAHRTHPGLIATYAATLNIHTGEYRQAMEGSGYDNLVDGIIGTRGWATGSLLWNYTMIKNLQWPTIRKVEDSHFELSAALINPRVRLVPEAMIYIDQTWDMERLINRNRLDNDPARLRYLDLYERLLFYYPFGDEESKRKRYIRRTVHHWVRVCHYSRWTYLQKMFSIARYGRWNVFLTMLAYASKFMLGMYKKKG